MATQKRVSSAILLVLIITAVIGSTARGEPANPQWNPLVFPISYEVNPTVDAPEGFADIVQECATLWHQVVGSSMTFRYGGVTTRGAVTGDGFNLIGWNESGDGMDGAVVQTTIRTNDNGYIIECDTVFNGQCDWSTTGAPGPSEYDVKTAALREIGRWVQLAYNSDPTSVMFDTLTEGVVRDTLSEADEAAISAVYPAAHLPDEYEDGDDTCAGASELAMGQPHTGHNIYAPGDLATSTDEDWFRFTLGAPTSVRIATSGPDPLGDTELFLYDSCPAGDPIGHSDDITVPAVSLPSTESQHNFDGSYEFKVNIGEGVVVINHVLYDVPAQADFVVAQGGSSPFSGANTEIVCSVVVYENGGAVALAGIAGSAAPAGSAQAPTDVEIEALMTPNPWVRIGNTRFQLPTTIEQNYETITGSPPDPSRNVSIEVLSPTTASTYSNDGTHQFRVDTDTGVAVIDDVPHNLSAVADHPVAGGGTSPFSLVNTSIIYAIVLVNDESFTSVDGGAAPGGTVSPPSDTDITTAVGHGSWARIGHTQIDLGLVQQAIESVPLGDSQAASPLYAALETAGLPAGTYYVKVQSSDAGGRPVVDPYSIVLLPGAVDGFESDDSRDNAKRIYPDEIQARSISPAGDEDWAYFVLAEDARVIIETFGPGGPGDNGDTIMALHSVGSKIADNDDKAPGDWYSRIEIFKLLAGTYWVQVKEVSQFEVLANYTLVLQQLPAISDIYEPDDTWQQASELIPSDPQHHAIDPEGDHDWMYFTLTEMVAEVSIEVSGFYNADTYMELYDTELCADPLAAPIAFDDDSGQGSYSKITQIDMAAGTYYVLVRQKDDDTLIDEYDVVLVLPECTDAYEFDNTHEYAKVITPHVTDWYGEVITPGVPMEHGICPVGDRDWARFATDTSGQDLVVETSGPEGGDTEIWLYYYDNGFLSLVDNNDDKAPGDWYSRIEVPGNIYAGTYFIDVAGYHDSEEVPQYFLTVTFTAHVPEPDDPGDTPDLAMELTDDVPSSGHTLSPLGDFDWYRVQIDSMLDIVLQVTGTGSKVVGLFDSTILASSDPNSEEPLASTTGEEWTQLQYAAVADTYYIRVNEEGNDHIVPDYEILVRIAEPFDFRVRPPWLYFTGSWQYPPGAETATVQHQLQEVAWSAVANRSWITVTPASGVVSPGTDRGEWHDSTEYSAGDVVSHTYDNGGEQVDTYLCTLGHTGPGVGSTHPSIDTTHWSQTTDRGEWADSTAYFEADLVLHTWDDNGQPMVDTYACISAHSGPGDESTHPSTDAAHWVRSSWRTQAVEVSVSIGAFAEGEYQGLVTFTDDAGSPAFVAEVTLDVTESPAEIQWAPEDLTFSAIEGTVDPAPQGITLTNHGGGKTIDWSVDADEVWVALESDSGTLLKSDPSATITVTPDVSGLAVGVYTANLTLHGFEASPGDPPAEPLIILTVNEDTQPPNPVDFAVGPHGDDDDVPAADFIEMTAAPTTDPQGGLLQYQFVFAGGDAGGADSGWMSATTFTLPGLVPGGYYSYRVRARDTSSQLNMTDLSEKMSGYVAPAVPPAPTVGAPTEVGVLSVTPGRGSNSERVELAIRNVTDDVYVDRNGEPSSEKTWRTEAEWGTVNVVGLRNNTEYAFQVIARNGQGIESANSPSGFGTTLDIGVPGAPGWDPASPTSVAADSISLQCTSVTGGAEYEFNNVTTGQTSGWADSLDHPFVGLLPCSQYEFKVRARNAGEIPGEWSAAVFIYTLPSDPGEPGFVHDPDGGDFAFAVDPNPAGGEELAEYAIQINQDLFVGLDGMEGSVEKVWTTRQDWLLTPLQDFEAGEEYQFCLYARNPDEVETGPGPNITRKIDFRPPQPDPAKMDPGDTKVYLDPYLYVHVHAMHANDLGGVWYLFECVDGVYDDSTWAWHTYKYEEIHPVGVTAVTSSFRVRYRDLTWNLTAWSEPLAVDIPPTAPGVPIDRGYSASTAFVEIDRGINAVSAEYAIHVQDQNFGSGIQGYVDVDGSLSIEEVWQQYNDWDNIVTITGLAPVSTIHVTVKVRRLGGTITKSSDVLVMILLGDVDTDPPTPELMLFDPPFPTAAGTTSLTMTAVTATDTLPVMYGFQQGVEEMVWTWDPVYTVGGLTPATEYSFLVQAKDMAGNPNTASDPSSACTLADVPDAPSVSPGSETMNLNINPAGNPATVEFAVYDHELLKYLAADDTLTSDTPVWDTITGWGGTIVIGGIVPSSAHSLAVKARNPDNVETVLGPATDVVAAYQDEDPPNPNPAEFAETPAATGTDSFRATAVAATDYSFPVEYYFGVTSAEPGAVDRDWGTGPVYELTGLTPGGKYTIILVARDSTLEQHETIPSAPAIVYIDPLLPGSPTASNVLSTSVALDFATGSNSDETLYCVFESRTGQYVDAVGALAPIAPVWRSAADWGGPFAVSGLQSGSLYYFSVAAASKDEAATGYSPETVIGTIPDTPGAPTAPAEHLGSRQLRLQLDDTGNWDSATTFLIRVDGAAQYVQADGTVGPAEVWQTLNLWNSPAFVDGLLPETSYSFDVRAKLAGSSSEWSTAIDVLTKADLPTPGAPAIPPGEIGLHSMDLQLDDTPGWDPATTFLIRITNGTTRYLQADGTLGPIEAWRTLAQWGDPAAVDGLTPATTYFFDVQAKLGVLLSQWSTKTEAQTSVGLRTPDPPSVPEGNLGSVSLKLQLDDPGDWDPATTFLIRATSAGQQYVQPDNTLGLGEAWQTLADWDNPVFIRTLSSDTTYFFDVRAKLNDQLSGWSTQMEVLTNITGDCTGDDAVNILDMLMVRNKLGMSPESDQNFLTDVTDDGTINILDMLHVRNHLGDSR